MKQLDIQGISKSFHQKVVLANINASIRPGEFVSFVGPSGCGKSTLLNIIANIESANDGEVLFGGKNIADQDVISFMPQQDLLLPWRTALQNIVLPLELNGVGKKERYKTGAEVLRQFGLDEYMHHYPSSLSGGMRQRISFLRTYLCNKPLMLLDEPFGKLDAFTKMEVHRWLLNSWEKGNQTIIMVTHDLDEAILLSDRVFVMSKQPSTIVHELSVNLPRPRKLNMLASSEMKMDKEELLRILSSYLTK
ncbi:ABC transporter ATP-binding protein [Heyndrickxia ginsengihumi]|uniref:ABC transporter ATP-binding protein n=1 Tax=Heyndrickxia ginsengihumi TaxID=363870 RepID=A0A6M0P5R2_9BACI|nr:ABC transporter ATP-binding protein [Heyndrickxia ginsengihumi]MBE6182900.1 ABC transporter ATP-binding protein [Bacillus sp. (in: firmicutes)]MCM3023918.1 ABC transporter ATP-binding protein [Heyndrickxia ginsengihumi]NEY19891.1 ABC transporter ATP-binding protein [Heyndrickxia ginsengihumi]